MVHRATHEIIGARVDAHRGPDGGVVGGKQIGSARGGIDHHGTVAGHRQAQHAVAGTTHLGPGPPRRRMAWREPCQRTVRAVQHPQPALVRDRAHPGRLRCQGLAAGRQVDEIGGPHLAAARVHCVQRPRQGEDPQTRLARSRRTLLPPHSVAPSTRIVFPSRSETYAVIPCCPTTNRPPVRATRTEDATSAVNPSTRVTWPTARDANHTEPTIKSGRFAGNPRSMPNNTAAPRTTKISAIAITRPAQPRPARTRPARTRPARCRAPGHNLCHLTGAPAATEAPAAADRDSSRPTTGGC